MAVLDAKLPAWQASTKAISPTKAEAKTLEGKAPLSVDGGGLGSGQRVLLKDQTSKAQNGLYEVTRNEAIGGTGKLGGEGKLGVGESWTLTRTSDADTAEELAAGMLVPIEDGNTNQATSWVQRTEGAVEVGTTPLSFEALLAGARGNAAGDLEGLYAAPTVKEAVIDNSNVSPEAAIGYGKLNLASKVAASDLASTSKELFLQLVSATKRQVAFGSSELTYPGAAEDSNEVSVSTGAEVTPVAVLAISSGGSSGFNSWLRVTAKEKGKFKIRAFNPGKPSAGSTVAFDWIAVG